MKKAYRHEKSVPYVHVPICDVHLTALIWMPQVLRLKHSCKPVIIYMISLQLTDNVIAAQPYLMHMHTKQESKSRSRSLVHPIYVTIHAAVSFKTIVAYS